MTTWAELLADIRVDVKDTGDTPKFSDALIYVYVKDAIRDYSIWFPQRLDHVALVLASSKCALPSNYIQEIYVECPAGTYLEKRPERPGVRFPTQFRNYYYYIQGGSLYLSSPTDETVYLTYLASHDVPASVDDNSCVLTIPDADIELIRLYAKAQMYGQLRAKQAELDRFKPKGTRDDNPVTPEVGDLMAVYHAKIAERVRGGNILLYRKGRVR